MVDPDLFRTLPLTRLLDKATHGVLARSASGRSYARGKVLWTAGTEINYLALVIEGRVRVVRESKGRKHVVHTEGPGGTLGEVPFFTWGPAPATAIAAEPTRCVILNRSTITAGMTQDPAFAWLLMRRMAERVRLLVDRLDRLAVQDARIRLASLLLNAAEDACSTTISLGLTQAALAEELGTVREVVVRTLRAFREQGVVSPAGRGRFQIRDLAALRRLIAENT